MFDDPIRVIASTTEKEAKACMVNTRTFKNGSGEDVAVKPAVAGKLHLFFATARHLLELKSWEVGNHARKKLKTTHAQAMREVDIRADLARAEAARASSTAIEDVQVAFETGLPKVKLSLTVDQTMAREAHKTAEEKISEAYKRRKLKLGTLPSPGDEPTEDQLTEVDHLLNAGVPPRIQHVLPVLSALVQALDAWRTGIGG